MEAVLSIFGAKTDEEEEEDRIYEERKAKIEQYLSTMDPRRREFEEKKIKHYRLQGKEYLLPGEKPSKQRKSVLEPEIQSPVPDYQNKENGKITALSIVADADAATEDDREDMKAKIKQVREEQMKELSKASKLTEMPKPGQWHKTTLLTGRDNVKLRRKRQKLNAEKLARLKF